LSIEPVVAREEVVLARKLALELRLLLGIELRLFDDPVEVVVQVGIDELQLRCAVLVEEWNGGAVLDRLLKVVDRNVVAEDFLRAFLARDQRRAGESEELRFRQRRAHVERERVVLAAVCFVREHDDVRAVAQKLGRLELVYEREHVAVVAAQELPQVRPTVGVARIPFRL
jgi:hypothetical protein